MHFTQKIRLSFTALILGGVITLALIPHRADAQKISQADVDTMCGRLQEIITAHFPDSQTVAKLIGTMQADGSWKGIDYLNTGISVWPASTHLSHLAELTRAYGAKASPLYHTRELGEAVHRSLDYWLRHNFTSQNWWMNDIGIPNNLCDVLIVLGKEATQLELLQALNQMRGTYIDQTGQNRVWRAEIQLKIGLITFGKGRTNLLGSPTGRILGSSQVFQQEVVVRSDEGIQPDWSFHQHGVQQQFGNYGLSFASTVARWAWVLQGTPVAYPAEKIAILRGYVLRGLSRVVWKGVMDISGCGRQLFPDSPEGKGSAVIGILGTMEKADPPYAATYRNYRARLEGKPVPGLQLAENVYFWRSDLMVHRSDAFYSSVRMCSRKIQSTESGNGENLLGYHLSDGTTYIYQTGQEYQNIFPVWNWRHVPGVTCYSELPLPALGWGGLHNGNDFVGGVSDTAFGAVAFLFERNGLSAHKGWFYTDQGLVCLGAGITSARNTPVATTLNQNLFTGSISIKTSGRSKSLGIGQSYDGKNVKWVYEGGTGYVLLENSQIHVSADVQRGSWKRIHAQVKAEPLQSDVFNLWIDHGSAPRGASYAYMILPGARVTDMDRISRKPPVEILENDTTLQAVRLPGGVVQAIFYQPGELTLDGKTRLRADEPCLVIARSAGKTVTLTAAIPPEMSQVLTLRVQGHYTGENVTYDPASGQSVWQVPFRGGMYAGSSVTVTISAP